jgi:hypothetical protein
MSEFQLTHVALVGARIASFADYGYQSRMELAGQLIAPLETGTPVCSMSNQELHAMLRSQLPLWIHNIITDIRFPQRERLLMALRRFEGELKDSKTNDVVAGVLTNGFLNSNFDPLDLPADMPMRERCAMLVHIGVWQDAYRRLEEDVASVLALVPQALSDWIAEVSEHQLAATG